MPDSGDSMAEIIKLLKFNSLSEAVGKTRSSIYRDIKAGLLTPPIKIGGDRSAWPSNEIDAINRARIAGKSDSEIKQLVTELIDARTHTFQQHRVQDDKN
jgi:prophage regulatory protein